MEFALRETVLHGRAVGYRIAGSGPAVVLIHGMLNTSRHWRAVAERLAQTHTVIAPDLIGHGGSAGPMGDYSLGAHAAGIRDLLAGLGIDRATIVGHSLGGGVAMQFFYQFPERVERLALVSSGGLGREVSWPLRIAAAPGIEAILGAATSRPVLGVLRLIPSVYARAAHRALAGLSTAEARRGFLWTLRAVIGLGGQKVSANDRLYLLDGFPTLIVWGGRDHTIPRGPRPCRARRGGGLALRAARPRAPLPAPGGRGRSGRRPPALPGGDPAGAPDGGRLGAPDAARPAPAAAAQLAGEAAAVRPPPSPVRLGHGQHDDGGDDGEDEAEDVELADVTGPDHSARSCRR